MRLTTRKVKIKISATCKEKILVDPIRVRQVLINLITNAISHAPEKSEIIVTCTKKGKSVVISIGNFGERIPKEDIPKIFDPFYQSSKSQSTGGLGLGLYICRQIVELHGGQIWVKSHAKKGTFFTFSLPIGS
jgi:signal transduction histidine kinase